MKVKPAQGRAVRDPITMQLLPDDGREVPNNPFWRRRRRDGDVVVVEDKAAPAARERATARAE